MRVKIIAHKLKRAVIKVIFNNKFVINHYYADVA